MNDSRATTAYRLLLRVLYPKEPVEYRPGLASKRNFNVFFFVKLAVAFLACWALFGFPEPVRRDSDGLVLVSWVSFAGAAYFLSVLLGSLYFHLRRWVFTLWLHGPVPLSVFRSMRVAYSHRAFPTEAPPMRAILLGSIFLLVYWWTRTPFALFLGVFMIYNCTLARALRMYLPPSALFLTASGAGTDLHSHLAFYFNPFRIIQLLKGDKSSEEFKTLTRRDCYRTGSDDSWEKLVLAFIGICPIVILDSRQVTPALEVEAGHIMDSDISHKLIILVGASGERPLLDDLFRNSRKSFSHEVAAVREAGLLALLQLLFIKMRKLPAPDQLLNSILDASREFENIQRDDWAAMPEKRITRKE
jgi:hypothetical protein